MITSLITFLILHEKIAINKGIFENAVAREVAGSNPVAPIFPLNSVFFV